jgi:ribonuclease G
MDSEILINVTPEETRVALLEGGLVVEFYVERKHDASLVGNIYKGRVLKILPGMQSAFVDIGLEKAAFLYITDIRADIADFEEYAPLVEEKDDSLDLVSKKGKTELTIEDLVQAPLGARGPALLPM